MRPFCYHTPMHIHFVCSGNAYRSRLAEAYLRSKLSNQTVTVSSSGINAQKNRALNGPISWLAMRILQRHNLISYMSWLEQQTSKKLLAAADRIIFMRQEHVDHCRDKLNYRGDNHEVWDIPDVSEYDEFIPSKGNGYKADINHIKLSEKSYHLITQKVDNLLSKL